jgi:hypothetical protein
MNVTEFNGGILTLREEFVYMFPISIAIISTSFILAFSSSAFFRSCAQLAWAIIISPFQLAAAYVLTKSGLYIWSRELAQKASTLKEKDGKSTAMMQANAMREVIEKRARKAIDEVEMEFQEKTKGKNMRLPITDVEKGENSVNESKSVLYSPRM